MLRLIALAPGISLAASAHAAGRDPMQHFFHPFQVLAIDTLGAQGQTQPSKGT